MADARFSSLSPEDKASVSFVHCLEAADGAAQLLPLDIRAAASQSAAAHASEAAFLRDRSRRLLAALPSVWQEKSAALATPAPPWQRWALPATLAAAFLLGWFTNELGTARQINVLSFPILGLIAWNAAVAAWSIWSHWKKPAKPHTPAAPSLTSPDLLTQTTALYQSATATTTAPIRRASLRQAFHLAAIALTLGIITGMYTRGLARAYTVTWESTFLQEPQVRALTRVALGPASIVTNIPVPDPARGSAAPWIHLWAATAALFILVPRLLLWNMARLEQRAATNSLDNHWHRIAERCRDSSGSRAAILHVFPVHAEPDSPSRDALRVIAQHLWGPATLAHFHPPVAYGSEDDAFASLTEPPSLLALVFSLAATPEQDLHGTLAAAALTSLSTTGRAIALLDAAAFESRYASLPEYQDRLRSRLAAWRKILPPSLPVIILDSSARSNPAHTARSLALS